MTLSIAKNCSWTDKKALLVSIAAEPQDNKANKELITFLSRELGIKKDRIFLEHGEKSRLKVINIS
ncbi:MAG: DUF167 domain-containing protein [Pseudomonadota bacterium]